MTLAWRRLLPKKPKPPGCWPFMLLAMLVIPMGCSFRKIFPWNWGTSPSSPEDTGPCATDAFGLPCLLNWIAYCGTLVGALFLFAALGAVLFAPPNLKHYAPKLAVGGVALIVASQILMWLGANLWWISILVLVAGLGCLGVLAWRRRAHLEKILNKDLDGDGLIGPKKEQG